jgi:hypothetical protein
VYVTAAQAGKGPDLVMGAHDWIGNLVQNGTFAPRSRVRVGDQVEVVVDTERMHFFDPDTGNAIRG